MTGLIVRTDDIAALELLAELAGTRGTRCGDFFMSEFELILVDHPADGVARITLNRPEKRNAISTPLRAELLAALGGPRLRRRRPGYGHTGGG